MNWRKFINDLPNKDNEAGWEFYNPVSPREVLQFFRTFQYDFPEELEELYKQTDGISNTLNGIIIGTLIWPLERVIKENNELRTDKENKELYLPFDHFLFFSDSGCGDLFGFVVLNGVVKNKVFVWNHEDDSRSWVAPSLKTFVEWWILGKIKI